MKKSIVALAMLSVVSVSAPAVASGNVSLTSGDWKVLKFVDDFDDSVSYQLYSVGKNRNLRIDLSCKSDFVTYVGYQGVDDNISVKYRIDKNDTVRFYGNHIVSSDLIYTDSQFNIDQMKKGHNLKMQINGYSSIKDTISLKGFTKAYNLFNSKCAK